MSSTTSSTTKSRLSRSERKERTLTKIAETFAEHGFNGTTTADLAESAGISEAMLYKLFGSKKNLYRELIEQKIREVDEKRNLPIQEAQQNKDREVFRQVGMDVLTIMRDDPALIRLLLYSGLEENEVSDLFFEHHFQRTITFLSDYIADRMEEGAFRDGDSELIALSFLGMICKRVQTREIFDVPVAEHVGDEAAVEQHVDLILNGLQT